MTTENQPNYGDRYKAHAKVADAKRKMDDAMAALNMAEDAWHQACLDRDRLEGTEPPSFQEMRGILAPDKRT